MKATSFFNGWPKWTERIDILTEAVVLMKTKWRSENYFTHQGKYFTAVNFFLYTKPKMTTPIYFAAQGKKAVVCAGIYGDHTVTINSPEICRSVIFPAFEQAAKKVGNDSSKMEIMRAKFM